MTHDLSGEAPFTLHLGHAELHPEIEPGVAFREVPDADGTAYLVPYLQQSPHLYVSVSFRDRNTGALRLRCEGAAGMALDAEVTPDRPVAGFRQLPPGEYTITATAGDAGAPLQALRRVGIGMALAALGDGITEGYLGNGYLVDSPLHAGKFPRDAVSRDGRNFPQYAPTAHRALPIVNCLQSWMTDLNDLLAETAGYPVLIANEGWAGATSSTYLAMLRTDKGLAQRLHLLDPRVWLLHLGVEDARAKTPPAQYAANMAEIARLLLDEYRAHPACVLVAKPSYDFTDGVAPLLAEYNKTLDTLACDLGLSAGPNFYAAFMREKARYYGADNAYPNVNGMRHMAALWHRAIVQALWPES